MKTAYCNVSQKEMRSGDNESAAAVDSLKGILAFLGAFR
jgi:hypothetical protein